MSQLKLGRLMFFAGILFDLCYRLYDDATIFGYIGDDLFTLLKVDGSWKIMNKVFYLHA